MSRRPRPSRLRQAIAGEAEGLRGTLRVYLYRAGLADGADLERAAAELLNEVVVEALAHEDRFQAGRKARPWLLGIAANLIRRRQAAERRQTLREPLVRDLYPGDEDAFSDDELFDWIAELAGAATEDTHEAEARAEALLAPLPQAERQVIRLAVLHELDGRALAAALGTTPGAARVRLSRALAKLRLLYPTRQEANDA